MTQVYHNSSDSSTGRCKYCFPVPENAAICAFGMTTSDGHALRGIAKEKDQAREEYQDALNSRKFAGILDYVTGDSQYCYLRSFPASLTAMSSFHDFYWRDTCSDKGRNKLSGQSCSTAFS